MWFLIGVLVTLLIVVLRLLVLHKEYAYNHLLQVATNYTRIVNRIPLCIMIIFCPLWMWHNLLMNPEPRTVASAMLAAMFWVVAVVLTILNIYTAFVEQV